MKYLHIPYYLRLRDSLAKKIEDGSLLPHSKLPSERDLKDAYDINRVTVRQALMQLESEGLIYRLIRRGWYVSPPRLFYDPTQSISFMDNVRAQGRVPETVILSKTEMAASDWVNRTMGITLGDPVYLLRRRRLIDGRAVLVEHINVNPVLCPGLLDLPLECSLTETLKEQYGIEISRTVINMYPAPLDGTQAEELQVVAGAPCLYLTRASYDQHDNIVEFDQEFWRHDVLEISMEVKNT
ncbi:UTRA domain-containing protein [Amphritea sp. 2_MG-2023]|jgi:DNA-binding GntR family transcriptional regulator|uniref:UTRA domain-containing protein n=1 Tax=Amphritea TaxID=515417 RepID=UPI001C07754A|nr:MULTISPECIES: UTRA domain-containing protein [Amphritea]MBU2964105.1 UTRA domain-containing protein [Amphritea atlantica]MDO6418503.1 UTRA domain-containing protein [Amphritea sp. 2_MG-2023]MDX2424414.1 UTRA domain-containing protein [Amphritea sp.]